MKIIDTHCDVLYKLQMNKRMNNTSFNFRTSNELDVNLKRMQVGGVYVQIFAIFIDPNIHEDDKWAYVCEQIELFHTEVLANNPELKHIQKWEEISSLKDGEIGVILALEGIEPIGEDLEKLVYLYEQGVLSVGLTWNKANLAADGALERCHGGLTSFGKQVIELNNEYGILTDLSHLSERSFWDVIHHAHYVYASHSNARTICDHPRNLSDIQLSALFAKGGVVHVTFYPPFLEERHDVIKVTTEHIIRHIDYICSIGGKNHIGFGSDFDGINLYVEDLQHAGAYKPFIEKLLAYFSDEDVRRFSRGNFLQFLSRVAGGK